jgi:hypothetical protein
MKRPDVPLLTRYGVALTEFVKCFGRALEDITTFVPRPEHNSHDPGEQNGKPEVLAPHSIEMASISSPRHGPFFHSTLHAQMKPEMLVVSL